MPHSLHIPGFTGEIITPCNKLYEHARLVYNRAVQKLPSAIAYCGTVEDVAAGVSWCHNRDIPLRIRNGEHNYEGYSVGNSVWVLDVSRMNTMVIDEENGLLHVEGGVNNRELYEAVSSKGYPFAGGTCPDVGVAYALGAMPFRGQPFLRYIPARWH